MPEADLKPVVDFLYELGLLKRLKRTGWWVAGIKDPETVAEHSFRVAMIGFLLAEIEGVDAGKTAIMCLLHDSQEARTGDVPHVSRPYIHAASNHRVTADQTARFPDSLGSSIRSRVDEYEQRQSLESQIAHDADKLELVLQSREYQAQGSYDTDDWLQNSLAALKTPAARRLATLACSVPPDHWWRAALESASGGDDDRP